MGHMSLGMFMPAMVTATCLYHEVLFTGWLVKILSGSSLEFLPPVCSYTEYKEGE